MLEQMEAERARLLELMEAERARLLEQARAVATTTWKRALCERAHARERVRQSTTSVTNTMTPAAQGLCALRR